MLNDTNYDSTILKSEVEVAVEILTTNCCSEEGLEDCTDVLLALSRSHLSLRIQVLKQLLVGIVHSFSFCIPISNIFIGALKLGNMLREQITQLLEQLRNRKTTEKEDEKQSELQLPAMQLLTSKNSVQAFFLRILKVASFCIM